MPEPVDFALLCQRAVFPMMEDLLQPQVNARDPQGMPETRLRASTLLCKSFLHFSVRSAENVEQTGKLWLSILDILDRFMHSGRRDQLVRACDGKVIRPPSSSLFVPSSTRLCRNR